MFDKDTIAQIRNDVNVALAAVAAKHGVTFNVGVIRFTTDSFRCTLTAAASNPVTGTVESLEYKELRTTGRRILGLSEADLSKTYSSRTLGTVKFVGYHSRKHKYPFIVETVNTKKRYKISKAVAASMVPSGV